MVLRCWIWLPISLFYFKIFRFSDGGCGIIFLKKSDPAADNDKAESLVNRYRLEKITSERVIIIKSNIGILCVGGSLVKGPS